MFRSSKNKNTTTVAVVADAVPILGNPYPIPNVYRLVGKKQDTTTTGTSTSIKFRTIESNGIVIIDDICDPILIQHDSVRYHIGRVVISINDITVRDSSHATSLLLKNNNTNGNDNDNEYYTILSRDPITVPFCKLIVGTYNVHTNPGISFASTRDETLVQISRILVDGPFNNNTNNNNKEKSAAAVATASQVKIGDIALAVNGYAVTTTEQAYRALQLSKNTSIQDSNGSICTSTMKNKVLYNTIILYVIDIMQLRCSILREVKCIKHLSFNKVRIETTNDTTYSTSNSNNTNNNNDAVFIVHDINLALVKFDTNTQNIYDKEQYRHRFTKNEVRIYQDVVVPYLRHCNEIMEKRMLILEDSVACESWTNPIPYLPAHVQLRQQQRQRYSLVYHDDTTAVVLPSSSSELVQYHQSSDRATNGGTINNNTTATNSNGILQFDAISYLLSNDNQLSSTSAVYNRRGHAATTTPSSDGHNEIILDAIAVPISSPESDCITIFN